MVVIDCGVLVDGRADDPLSDARIVVEDETVAAVGPREDVDASDAHAHVSYPDATVIPGLIDAHAHLQGSRSMNPMDWVTDGDALSAARATADLRDLLDAGFTSVRDVGSTTGLGLREAVESGDIPGPRVYTSGQSISQTAGHGDSHSLPYEWAADAGLGISTLADGPAECRKAARKQIREGVDSLKIMTTGGVLSERDAPDQSQFTDDEIAAMTEEAHRVGIPVASHAQGAAGIKSALRNGVDTIEHGFYVDDAAVDLLLSTDATFVPTLAIMHRIVEHGDEHGVPEHGLRKAREAYDAHRESVRKAYDAGVPIALGTDFLGPDLVPHGENAMEAELFVEEIGMSEMEAIQAGTRVAARTVPDDDIGTLEPGQRADIVVLDENPLTDISAVRESVRAVYARGEEA
ncbi:amidohydrolase family protein [Salarchaeum sp. JOR-1]|uniref:metal-dependent hydrolase family protein n=1 Tax=Salarchaeum sp. JOR-1 TaxID=2599399 RepID=UPI001198ADF8|nr:amidohydrolase family protein [Salarchaeum sp. JOR-1]QDX41414.1 amidohydrolase family protein [Salarchaeum sp. JOR-1]